MFEKSSFTPRIKNGVSGGEKYIIQIFNHIKVGHLAEFLKVFKSIL